MNEACPKKTKKLTGNENLLRKSGLRAQRLGLTKNRWSLLQQQKRPAPHSNVPNADIGLPRAWDKQIT